MPPWTDILPAWFVLPAAFLMGTLVGSFVNVLIYRLPEGQSVVTPPSRCPGCGHRLGTWDLVPLLSFLAAGRKCRYCREPVSWQYFWIELLTGITFLAVIWRFGLTMNGLLLCALLAVWIAALVIDLRHFIIPDALNLTGIAIAVLRAISAEHTSVYGSWGPRPIGTAPTAVEAVVGGAGLAGLLWLITKGGTLLFRRQVEEQQRQWDEEGLLEEGEQLEAMGMGDVYLAAAMGANLGLLGGLVALFVSVGAGALYGIALKAANRLRGHAIPFGPFLILGAVASLFYGERMLAWYLARMAGG